MKILHLKFVLILLALTEESKYKATLLPELIQQSDLIAECQIINLDKEQFFTIDICKFLKGNSKTNLISVLCFKNWTCAGRGNTYKIGQTELIFLSRNGNTNRWQILGAGDEGEMPIEELNLYYKNPYLNLEPAEQYYELKDGQLFGYKYKLADVEYAISDFLYNRIQYYKLANNKDYKGSKIKNSFVTRIIEELRHSL